MQSVALHFVRLLSTVTRQWKATKSWLQELHQRRSRNAMCPSQKVAYIDEHGSAGPGNCAAGAVCSRGRRQAAYGYSMLPKKKRPPEEGNVLIDDCTVVMDIALLTENRSLVLHPYKHRPPDGGPATVQP